MKEWLKKMAQMLKSSVETGAEAYGSASRPMAPQHAEVMANLLADMTPGVGDIKSGIEGVQAAREGDWLGAGMGALGALPFVPAMGGMIRDLPTLKWNKMRGEPSFPVGDWREEGRIIKSEMDEIARDAQSQTEYGKTLRALANRETGKIEFAWPWGSAHHSDIGNKFELDPAKYREITIEPPH